MGKLKLFMAVVLSAMFLLGCGDDTHNDNINDDIPVTELNLEDFLEIAWSEEGLWLVIESRNGLVSGNLKRTESSTLKPGAIFETLTIVDEYFNYSDGGQIFYDGKRTYIDDPDIDTLNGTIEFRGKYSGELKYLNLEMQMNDDIFEYISGVVSINNINITNKYMAWLNNQ